MYAFFFFHINLTVETANTLFIIISCMLFYKSQAKKKTNINKCPSVFIYFGYIQFVYYYSQKGVILNKPAATLYTFYTWIIWLKMKCWITIYQMMAWNFVRFAVNLFTYVFYCQKETHICIYVYASANTQDQFKCSWVTGSKQIVDSFRCQRVGSYNIILYIGIIAELFYTGLTSVFNYFHSRLKLNNFFWALILYTYS